MTFVVRYTQGALDDLERLYDYLLVRDIELAEKAYQAIAKATEFLENFPFSCRKASADDAFLRELVIPFGSSGYVALFEIEDSETVTILAIRHQREEDYH
ncbi:MULTISPECIES: type II toxin-antitoxin system RelE/ParE family toxin [unclassified Rhizobium]|uniref:type II toxin-antitoxin system RelE/ParE family toxin n=1 Tax=unclassified Rhizobium TaxID=2613769 RepID=UPI000DDC5578|nr:MULTISPECIES: type II toxin-antitoxin system RelE/ParE family toxin [unclassified Rhizobium]MBB3288424.1 plasmid stabilization system protein ParE [Rhizobium sp. BK252]MBB3403439.1 plasmid stabilization system protein ParE [Rhizobium sp. BK289]MBB3416014.1 plasmid stabilization system protein ParE [Rhizobium sp. BK284]MBB3483902.1 plasmid stabilization system protein ParE [Rhizobium sp. BK347]MDK4722119.1 type II toxin-antitoxin system RelE/ParE family toxin [Rhizobium sp. CNPSo 3968]